MKTKKIKLSAKRETEHLPSGKLNPRNASKVTSVSLPDRIAEVKALEAEMWRPITLLNPEMLKTYEGDLSETYKNYPIIKDPKTGQDVHARVVSVKWLEAYKSRIKGKVTEGIRPRYVEPSKLMEVNAGLSKRKQKFVENDWWAQGFNGTGNSGFGFLGAGENAAYPPGPFTRQLYLQAMWDMQSRCFEIYNHYGIAKSAINTISYFVIGEGIRVDFDDEDAQNVWDEFIERTHLDRDWQTYCMMLSVNGELCFHLPAIMVNGESGYTDLLSVDPGTIWEIITVPKDIRKIKAYWVQYATQYQLYSVGGVLLADYIIEQLDPSEVVFVKINVQKNEKRGRSDLLASLSDLKMLQDINKYRSVRVINEAALVFDQKITGDDTDVSNIAGLGDGLLGAGTTYTHNESSELEIKSATMSATSKSGFHDEQLSQIGTGIGSMPAEFIGGGSGSNRANALTKTEPSYKFFRTRQKKIEFTIHDVAKIVIANWNKAKGTALSSKCEVIFPEIAPEDRKDKLANIVLMESQEYWDHEKAATTAAKEMDDETYDYQDTQDKIKQERLDDPQLAFLFQPTAPGVVGATPSTNPAPVGSNSPKPGGLPSGGGAQLAQKNQGQYKTNSMGLGSDVKKSIKTQMKQTEAFEKEKHTLHKKPKAGHHMIKSGFRGRTSHTVQAEGEESMGGSSFPGQMRQVSLNDLKKEFDKMTNEKHPYCEFDWKEVAPPGWEDTVKAMKKHPGISNPFALSWAMSGQGYTPHAGKAKK